MSIQLRWQYIVPVLYKSNSNLFDNELLPIPFDIVVIYETEQEDDYKENHMFEELEFCLVEGLTDDWNSETLKLLKAEIKKTKMPLWYYLPKLLGVKIRPFVSIFLLVFIVTFLTPIFTANHTNDIQEKFNNLFIEANTAIDKIDVLYSYITRPSDFSFFIPYAISMGISAIIYSVVTYLYRYITPPSMFLFGFYKEKQKRVLTVYNFIWVSVILLGVIVPILISQLI